MKASDRVHIKCEQRSFCCDDPDVFTSQPYSPHDP